jgi:hypothetical protein
LRLDLTDSRTHLCGIGDVAVDGPESIRTELGGKVVTHRRSAGQPGDAMTGICKVAAQGLA